MSWHVPAGRSRRIPPAGFVRPCQPTLVARPLVGSDWRQEVKHDGYRIVAQKQGERVSLWTRRGANFTDRLPQIAELVRGLVAEHA